MIQRYSHPEEDINLFHLCVFSQFTCAFQLLCGPPVQTGAVSWRESKEDRKQPSVSAVSLNE